MIKKIIFIVILFLALFLRVYQLDKVPPALNWDEISLGYNAYSILKTGKDEWGEFLPLSFKAYGDYKLPLFIYLDVPFVAVLGLNEWGLRLPSATFGVVGVLGIYLIIKRLTKREDLALWGFFIAAITPWLIILSRIALEANLTLTLTIFGVYFFFLGLEKKWSLILSGLFFGLTIFSYNSSRVVTPLLVLMLSVFYFKELTKLRSILKYSVLGLAIFITFFIIAFPKALQQDSSARYKWTTILDEGAINRINELRGSSALLPALSQIQYNKVTYLIPEFLKNYISHFDQKFLFLNGGNNYQFSIPGSGLFPWILGLLGLLGVLRIFRERKSWQIVLVFWWIISIIPAAITRDAPHALRSLMMIPPIIIISTLGVGWCFNDLNQWIRMDKKLLIKLVSLVLIISLSLNLVVFWKNYTGDYVKNYSWSWQYGYKQAIDFIKVNGDKYEKIYITKKYGEPHEFILFYLKFSPEQYHNDPNLNRYQRSDWFWVDSFERYVFVNDWEVKDNAKCKGERGKCLLITTPENSPGGEVVKTIDFLDGKRAFDIIELPQVQ